MNDQTSTIEAGTAIAFIRVEIDRADPGYVAHVDWAEGDNA